jgi:hypothetical protein
MVCVNDLEKHRPIMICWLDVTFLVLTLLFCRVRFQFSAIRRAFPFRFVVVLLVFVGSFWISWWK